MLVPDEYLREAWPVGARDAATAELARVRRDPDAGAELRRLEDLLEQANRRALDHWLRSGRAL